MQENAIIETEDLRFIYKMVLDGKSDPEILNAYSSLKNRDGSTVTTQADIDFIKNKRREMEIVSEVLKDGIEAITRMLVPRQREGHFTQIKEISNILLEQNLRTIVEYPSQAMDGQGSRFSGATVFTVKDKNDIPVRLSRMQLIELFTNNVDKAIKMHGVSFFYECYAYHLQATVGEEMEMEGGFWPEVEKKPYKVLKAIEDIVDGKKIKGNCPMCNVETQLPPFIKSAFGDILQKYSGF